MRFTGFKTQVEYLETHELQDVTLYENGNQAHNDRNDCKTEQQTDPSDVPFFHVPPPAVKHALSEHRNTSVHYSMQEVYFWLHYLLLIKISIAMYLFNAVSIWM